MELSPFNLSISNARSGQGGSADSALLRDRWPQLPSSVTMLKALLVTRYSQNNNDQFTEILIYFFNMKSHLNSWACSNAYTMQEPTFFATQ